MKDQAIQAKVDNSSRQPATGPQGASKAHPGYGIDFLDSQRPNRTGLPDSLKAGVEVLSGLSLDDVRVQYHSEKPAQLQALAYTQGTEIHVGPGQEKHLPHEAWHAVQQKQGRVSATKQMKEGGGINHDKHLEREADEMGAKSLQMNVARHDAGSWSDSDRRSLSGQQSASAPIQFKLASLEDVVPKNLSAHRTVINGSNIAEGRGAITNTGKDLKTKITWEPLDADTGEGTGVECNPIGPDHPLGSETGSKGISSRVKMFNEAFAGSWKQGHLLNANLGGPGDDARNLVAISQSTNASMSDNFENELQRRINGKGEWMHFKANVKQAPITNEKSKDAADDAGLSKKQRKWANALHFSWGAVDEDGNKTGTTHELTLEAGEPVKIGKKVPKTGKESGKKDVGTNAAAVTDIGEEDVILDSEKNVAYQVEKKANTLSKKYDDLIMEEIAYPPSPLRQQEYVDEKMTANYPEFKPLTDFKGGIRQVRWINQNKKSFDSAPYKKSLVKHIQDAKLATEYNYPKQLGKLLKDNADNKNLPAALEEAGKQYPALGKKVEETRGVLSTIIGPEDYKSFVGEFYADNPKKFKDYCITLQSKL